MSPQNGPLRASSQRGFAAATLCSAAPKSWSAIRRFVLTDAAERLIGWSSDLDFGRRQKNVGVSMPCATAWHWYFLGNSGIVADISAGGEPVPEIRDLGMLARHNADCELGG
jgi:hypothetical protein